LKRVHVRDPLGSVPSQESDHSPASVSFSEQLSGFIDFDENDYERAFRAGAGAGRRLALQLRVTADDVRRFAADGRHAARVTGWVRGDALGGTLEIEGGEFTVLEGAGGERRLGYRLRVHDGAGRPLTIAGYKLAVDGLPAPLRTRVLAGHVEDADDAAVVATGLLQMPDDGIAAQIATFRVAPPLALDALAHFGALVVGHAWDAPR
jgi:cholesterol oxidase